MVSYGRSASLFASFCSLFDPRFRFACPRTAGAQLRAPIKGKPFGCVHTRFSFPTSGSTFMFGFAPYRVEKLSRSD